MDVVGHQAVGNNFYAQCFLELEQVNVFTWGALNEYELFASYDFLEFLWF